MFSHLIKSGELLDQQMLQDTSGVDLFLAGHLKVSLAFCPEGIQLGPSPGLSVFKIRNLPCENPDISRLINIKLGGHLRPETMVHPYTGDSVSVCDKVSVSGSYDGSVSAVNADSGEIFLNHSSYVFRIH